jgi:ketosteroid isomerase-like protein
MMTPTMAPADADEVRRTSDAFYRAFESLELARMDDVWSHDEHVVCVHPGWNRLIGWTDVRKGFQQIFANTVDIKFRIDESSLRVSGDLAAMSVVENLRSRVADGGVVGQVLAINVFERQQGVWKIVCHHATPFEAQPTPPSDGMVH